MSVIIFFYRFYGVTVWSNLAVNDPGRPFWKNKWLYQIDHNSRRNRKKTAFSIRETVPRTPMQNPRTVSLRTLHN